MLHHHLLNRNINIGCKEFIGSNNFDEYNYEYCKTCKYLDYEHKNKKINSNGDFQLTIINDKTKEYDTINVNIYNRISDVIEIIAKKYNVQLPNEIYYLHLLGIEHLESPFQCIKSIQLNELNIDFKCNRCVLSYHIGNKLTEMYYNCCIVTFCFPIACFCLPQMKFDLISEVLFDNVITCTSCLCTCHCCFNNNNNNRSNSNNSNNSNDLTSNLLANNN